MTRAMEALADAHVAAFNAAVASGDWARFAARFADDAAMAFDGVPVGPFVGRRVIEAAYTASPPREGVERTGPVVDDGVQVAVPYRWVDTGGTGTMRVAFAPDGKVRRLVVAFDPPA